MSTFSKKQLEDLAVLLVTDFNKQALELSQKSLQYSQAVEGIKAFMDQIIKLEAESAKGEEGTNGRVEES